MNMQFQPDTQGFWFNIPDDVYYAAPGITYQMLNKIARSPAHCQTYLNTPFEVTPAVLWHKILHHCLLTPQQPPFWVVAPEGMKFNTKAGKDWKSEQGNTPIISQANWLNIQQAVQNIRNHEIAGPLLENSHPKVGGFAHYTVNDPHANPPQVLRKIHIDLLKQQPGNHQIIFFRATDDAHPNSFSKRFLNESQGGCGYALRAAYTCDAWKDLQQNVPCEILFVAVEKEPPNAVCVYSPCPNMLIKASQEWQQLITQYSRCNQTNHWPAYPSVIHGVCDLNHPCDLNHHQHPSPPKP